MKTRTRLLIAALLAPTATKALGVDGGAIFQIAATENLGLSPRAVGIGMGLGVLSVPIQIWAARLPLSRAKRNLQLYFLLVAAQCAVMAVLVAAVDNGSRLAVLALAVTVLAEINVSVLFATTWQPLLAFTLTPQERQGIQSRGSAASGLVNAASALLFGAVGRAVRVVFYAVAAAVTAGLAAVVDPVPAPAGPAAATADDADDDNAAAAHDTPAAKAPPFAAIGIAAAGLTWPLFIVFVDQVLWPDINLGLVAAVQVSGGLLASALWRTTTADVGMRARLAGAGSLAAAIGIALIPGRIDNPTEEAVFFACAAGAAAATTIVFLSLIELAHRAIDEHTAVRAMTIYDVVASTSMQAGLLAAGFLISAGSMPYRVYLVVMAVAANASIRGSTG